MDSSVIAFVIAGAAAGGFVNGFAGFGTGLMSLGIWLQAMSAQEAVPVVAAMSVISGVQSLWVTRRTLSSGLPRLPRFLLPALIGLPLGTLFLTWIDASVIKLTVAFFMLAYSVFFVVRADLPQLSKPMPVADAAVGFASGFLGGAASLSGVVPTMWCAVQPWSKHETSAVLRPFNVVVLGIATAVYTWQGYFTMHVLIMMAVAVPATLIASQIGLAVFKRVSDNTFRRLLLWIMIGGAVSLIVREAILQ